VQQYENREIHGVFGEVEEAMSLLRREKES